MFSLLNKALEVSFGLGHLPLNYFSDPHPAPPPQLPVTLDFTFYGSEE